MSFTLPPVVMLAERLLVDVEKAVRRFARFHKYTFGTDLRTSAMEVATLAHRAWREPIRRREWLDQLVHAVDGLKLRLQLGSRIQAFASFKQFEQFARLASDLGRQVGGWYREQKHPKGQNDQHRNAGQRAQILSSQATSTEVKP
jgi:hypothetical protein